MSRTFHKTLRTSAAAVAAYACLASANAAADTPQPSSYSGDIGVVAIDAPRYPGSAHQREQLLPTGELVYERRYFASVIDGLGMNLYLDAHWRIGAGVAYDGSYRHASDDARLAGMGDVPSSLRARAFVRYQNGAYALSGSLAQDISGRGTGLVGDIDGALRWQLGSKLSVAVGPGLTWGNGRYAQTWFGVSAGQSAASGLPAERADSGITSERIRAAFTYRLAPQWFMNLNLNRSRLIGPAADSPVTDRKNQNQAQFAVIHSF